jgi:glycerol-3-phosphate acyltransferase PlsX
MKIAVDAMGGDFAPGAVVEGALRAAADADTSILLVGARDRIEAELRRHGAAASATDGCIEVVEAEEVVEMHEPAITPIRRKRRSSIRICAELVRAGRAQALVSAGHTGATMITAKMVIGTVDGVDRPALAAVFPNQGGRTVVLDVGANIDTKSVALRQFAVMGHFYAQEVVGTPAPRVGLLSIGEEESKGTDTTREVFKVLQETGLNFIGNVEGRDIFEGTADVVVCDGFVGNVVLKSAEALAAMLAGLLREELEQSLRTRLAGLLARPALERLRQRTDYREYGAAPLLGINGGCFIAHGDSNAHAIHSAIRRAVEFCAAELHLKIGDRVAKLHQEEERFLGSGGDEAGRPPSKGDES